MKVSIFNFFILLSCNGLFSQSVDTIYSVEVLDSMILSIGDTIEANIFNKTHNLTIGASNARFNSNTQPQSTYSLQYATQLNEKWNVGGGISYIGQELKNSNQFSLNIQRSIAKGGLGLMIEKSDDILAPQSHQQLSFYRLIKDDLIFSSSVSRFTSSTRSDVWPNYLGLTKVKNGIGYTIGLTHDLAQIESFSPLAKASVTHESKKGNVLNAYFIIGRTLQPNYQIANLPVENNITGFGGWFKQYVTKRISIIGALGLTSIRSKNGNKFQIINSSLSISTRF